MNPPSTLERELALRIESDIENAVRVLTHYVTQGWSDELKASSLFDAKAEIRNVVEAIVSASVLTIQKNKIERITAHGMLQRQPPMELLHGGTHHDEEEDPIEQNNRDWESARGREGSRSQAIDSLPENFRRELDENL